jgi:hypothetical protein
MNATSASLAANHVVLPQTIDQTLLANRPSQLNRDVDRLVEMASSSCTAAFDTAVARTRSEQNYRVPALSALHQARSTKHQE